MGCLALNELQHLNIYCDSVLKQMKSDVDQKRDLLAAMESDLAKAVHWNGQISASFHKCDVDLSKYSDLVGQMSDRWRRIQTQIDSRLVSPFMSTLFFSFLSVDIPPNPTFVISGNNTENILSSLPPHPTLSFSECGTWKSRRNN